MAYTPRAKPYSLDFKSIANLPGLFASATRMFQEVYEDVALVAKDVAAISIIVDLATSITGILGLAHGGTGIDASGVTDGQLLIGKTSDHTLHLAAVTAGSGITVTNGAGSVTVASSVSNAQRLTRVMLQG